MLSGFFSAAETAFSSLNKYRFQVAKDDGSRTAALVLKVYGMFDTALAAILIMNNAASVVLSVMSTRAFLLMLPVGFDSTLTSLISSIVITLFLYLFGETMPKQIARKIPNRTASLMVYPLYFFIIALYPFASLLRFFAWVAKKAFHSERGPELTEEDFNLVLESNEKHGLLDGTESNLIQASFDFADTAVKEVFTPANRMYEIDLKGLTNDQLAQKLCETKYSRIPVYYGDRGKIVGILIVKNFLSAFLRNPNVPLKDYIQKPYFVTPSIHMDDIVDGFRAHHTQIALVRKGSALLGMVTMEDVLEELVGPIGEGISPEKELAK
ncbi:MAG: hemolysin family protein [Bacilli bacterium]|nr:hemolysin family protein [Bacilli bacterium]